jgi:hypothetical protein
MAAEELLTPAETAIASRATLKAVYKAARERLPSGLVVRKHARLYFRPMAAVCIHIDHILPRDVPARVRKAFYVKVHRNPGAAVLEHKSGVLSYVLDAKTAADAVSAELGAYRKAMDVIVEDRDVQAGAATFKGTRLLVHMVADLL